MVERLPEFAGEVKHFSLQREAKAAAWVEAGGVAISEIRERSGGNRVHPSGPHIRVWGPRLQMEAWAAREGRPWNWVKQRQDGTVYFEISGKSAQAQLTLFGVRPNPTPEIERF